MPRWLNGWMEARWSLYSPLGAVLLNALGSSV
jgi:hypothetical protein